MKSFKCGFFEVMSHDYYRFPRYKNTIHINWKDYINANKWTDKFLYSLKNDGWRVPTKAEILFLYDELYKMNVGSFSRNWPPSSYYMIEPYEIRYSTNKATFFDFHNVKFYTNSENTSLANLRLVRSI